MANPIRIITLALIIISFVNNHPNVEGIQHSGKCQEDDPIIDMGPPLSQVKQLRSLQAQQLRGFLISGLVRQNLDPTINIQILMRVFMISANFFQNTLKVTNIMTRQDTKYPSQVSTTCGQEVPEVYKKFGFDVKKIDLLIFVLISNDPKSTVTATSTTCVLRRWPIYGYIRMNSYYFNNNFQKPVEFHKSVHTIIHQMTHILGFSQKLYKQLYFQSYLSKQKRRNNYEDIIIKGVSKRFITTPNVKKYVQKYFNCSDTNIGALLEQQGGNQSAFNHWERKVFLDQIMTASALYEGIKISPLTLHVLNDTGFYAEVNLLMSEEQQFGRGKGCQFAQGISNSSEYCQDSSLPKCDFYSNFGGYCSSGSNKFQSGGRLMNPYNKFVCSMSEYADFNSSQSVFSWQSKCFEGISQPGAHCYQSQCVNEGIKITIGKSSRICKPNDQKIKIQNITLKCPQNKKIFCARKTCPNWCSSTGLCLNGVCTSNVNCSQIHYNCTLCNNKLCVRCIDGQYPTLKQTSCDKCSNIINGCINCANTGGSPLCRQCEQGLVLSLDQQKCKRCSEEIKNCKSCYRVDSQIKCSQCDENLFLSKDELFCGLCSQVIDSCTSCVIRNQVTECGTCEKVKGWYLSEDQKTCLDCYFAIQNCETCIRQQKQINCQSCYHQYFPTLNKKSCTNCTSIIPNCQNCFLSEGGKTKCSRCSNNSYLNIAKDRCQICSNTITGCQTCEITSNKVQCSSCFQNYFLKSRSSCQTCNETIFNCAKCETITTIMKCSQCPMFGLSKCQLCTKNCQTCQIKSNVCKICNDGFYLSGNNCIQCRKKCKKCSSANVCLACLGNTKPLFGFC